MIKIDVKETDCIDKIEIKGHANYSLHGSDIVCASVSSIAITTVNAINSHEILFFHPCFISSILFTPFLYR